MWSIDEQVSPAMAACASRSGVTRVTVLQFRFAEDKEVDKNDHIEKSGDMAALAPHLYRARPALTLSADPASHSRRPTVSRNYHIGLRWSERCQVGGIEALPSCCEWAQ